MYPPLQCKYSTGNAKGKENSIKFNCSQAPIQVSRPLIHEYWIFLIKYSVKVQQRWFGSLGIVLYHWYNTLTEICGSLYLVHVNRKSIQITLGSLMGIIKTITMCSKVVLIVILYGDGLSIFMVHGIWNDDKLWSHNTLLSRLSYNEQQI